MQNPDLDTAEVIHRPGRVGRVLRVMERIELAAGAFLILVVLGLVTLQVVGRVTPMENQVWNGEIARYCLFWIAFGIAGYLMGREEHVTLGVIDHVLPRIGKMLVHHFSLLVVAATCLIFAFEGYDLLSSTGNLRTAASGIPVGWLYIIPTVGMVLTAARALLLVFVPASRPTYVRPEEEGAAVVPGGQASDGPERNPA